MTTITTTMKGSLRRNTNLSYFHDQQTIARFDEFVFEFAKGPNRCGNAMRRQRRRIKGMLPTMAVLMIAVLGTAIIRKSTAFIVVSPTKIKTTTTTTATAPSSKTITSFPPTYYCQSELPPPSSHSSRRRIRHGRMPSLILGATAEDNNHDNNNDNKKPDQKKTRKSNNKGKSNNNNSKKKLNKGGHKYKQSKSVRKNKPLDPSKQKKQEFMDQIKAKIKEEGEEKKRNQNTKQPQQQQQQNQNQKPKKTQQQQQYQQQQPQQKRSQKPNPSRPKDTNAQARLQNLSVEDPLDSQLEDENNYKKGARNNKNKLFMNPFQAGKSFRETLQDLSTLGRGLRLPKETKQKYFLDDRLLDGDDDAGNSKSNNANSNAPFFSSSLPLLQSNFNSKSANGLLQEYAEAEALAPIEYIPEVLVVGATGEIGRLVVRRLLLEGRGRFRVRVLVRDLYSHTLNLLGTGVSYCQGDLNDIESLEYSLTDVDKIVYVAGAPKPDESDFQRKFQLYLEEHDLTLSSSSTSTSSTMTTQDNDDSETNNNNNNNTNPKNSKQDQEQEQQDHLNDMEWEQLSSVLEVRSELAEQVDCIGMKNLVSAYLNVRHTDYGTSQAAKRSLFKFSKKSGDFDLFALDESDDDDDIADTDDNVNKDETGYDEDQYNDEDNYDGEYDEDKYEDVYDDYDEEEEYGVELESRNGKGTNNVVKAQVRWLRNKFDNGVFVGRVPRADANNPAANPGGEASIISSRLRAREEPDQGIEMSGFAGFIMRVVSDGNNYEAFVRTGLYETDGIEYVYQYSTESKKPTAGNRSQTRFKTIRLAFENFKPVQRRKSSRGDYNDDGNDDDEVEDSEDDVTTVPPFVGSDVRYLGFRFRSISNSKDERSNNKIKENLEQRFAKSRRIRANDYHRFYMALSYIKVYRSQPEPEFIYLSDARIPPVIRDGMVHHQRKVLLTDENVDPGQEEQPRGKRNSKRSNNRGGEGKISSNTKVSSNDAATTGAATTTTILDEKDLQRKSMLERSPEETYFKYRGEEILIKSGLSYTILRVAGFNELSTSEASTIDLVQSNSETSIVPVSRAEVAQVCVSALLDPCALNKCVYMTKKTVAGKNVLDEEDISAKFEGIPTDVIL